MTWSCSTVTFCSCYCTENIRRVDTEARSLHTLTAKSPATWESGEGNKWKRRLFRVPFVAFRGEGRLGLDPRVRKSVNPSVAPCQPGYATYDFKLRPQLITESMGIQSLFTTVHQILHGGEVTGEGGFLYPRPCISGNSSRARRQLIEA